MPIGMVLNVGEGFQPSLNTFDNQDVKGGLEALPYKRETGRRGRRPLLFPNLFFYWRKMRDPMRTKKNTTRWVVFFFVGRG